jgi:hypothetical protein
MDASSPPPSRNRLARAGRVLVGALVFTGGLLASGMFSSAVPAAPQDCLPVVGCVTTTIPSLPLSTVTLPTLPTSTGTTTTTTGGSPPSTTTADPTTTQATSQQAPKAPEAALVARTSVRVRGHGARRVVELRLQLTKEAGVSALLRRNSSVLARRQVQARAGTSLVVLRVARGAKPGLATLSVAFRTGSGETLRTTHRVRLPR